MITAQIDGTNNEYIAWFGGGVSYPAGAYVVTYLHGAYNWHDGSDGYWGNAAAVTDGNGNEAAYDPAPTFGDATINASQATAEAYFSDPSRNSVIYNHRGGRIGVRCLDGYTGDNTHGDPDPVFGLAPSQADDLKILITSADGTKRRWLPRFMLETPSWQIERYGGYGQCTLPTTLDYTAKSPIQLGDRIEIFYKGVRQYRGYVTERQRSEENPRKTIYTAYGAYVWLRKQIGGRNYAFAVDGVDASESFAAFAQDTLLTAIGPQGIRLVASVQALTIGTLEQALTARQELAGDVLDGLMDRCGNLAIWGVDVDDAGSNRLYIRPTDAAYPPTYMIPVPSPFVEVGDSEEQGGDVVNQLVIKGGTPQFPQLIHNGAFELPVPAGGPGSNVILAGSFEFGAPGSMDWTYSNGASTEAGKNSPPAVINAYLGDRYLELDHIGPPEEQASQSETFSPTAGHQYTFSFRAASEIEAPIGDAPFVSGHATITIKDGGGSTLFTQTLTAQPQGQSWDYYLTTFQMPAGAAAYEVLFVLDSITANSGQQGGLCIDDVQLYDSDSVTQDGWYVEVVDTPAEVIAVNWVYPSSWDGGYCVYLDATASNADNHDLKLTPQQGNRYKVSSGQDLTVNVWLKSPPVSTNPNPPEFFLELRWYDGSGHQISTSRSAHFTPGTLADWTKYTLTAFAPDNVASGDANITWRGAGSLLVDGFSVIDAAGTQPTGPADYMADGAVQFVIRADDAGLAAYRTAQGLGAAPYANSIAQYGPQGDTVQDDSILDRSGAYAVADAKFQAGALPYYRPSIRVLGDTRPYWPGQTISLQGKDGPSLAPTPLPISRIQGTFEAGTLKLTLQPFREQPDPILVFKKLAKQAALKYGTPTGASSGGGYTSATGTTVVGVPAATDTSLGIVQLAGDLAGIATAPTVTGLQGQPVAATPPTPGQALVWNGSEYLPTNLGVGTPSGWVTPTPAADGVTTIFTLPHTPLAGTLTVALRGLIRDPATEYAQAGASLTFASAPPAGSSILCQFQY
jgi:hypothetical protein